MEQVLEILGEYSTLISLVPLLIFVLVFLIYILQGLIRGFRKNLILTIISFVCFVIAYIIFLCMRSFATNQFLALIDEQLTKIETEMPTITPYIGVIINSILGIGFMIVTLVVWRILYFIAYLAIYLPIFREGKYKKKVNRRYYEAMDNPSGDIEVSSVEPYKKRRGFGALLGVFRGLLGGMLAISLFGSIFYLASGTYEPNLKDGEEVILQIDGKDVDLTNIYKFMEDYESINVVAESLKISGVPIYASLPNLYSWSKLVIKEDGINTTVYPYNEVAYVVKIAHTGINIIDKYEIRLDSTNIIDDLSNLLENNENFTTDVVNFIHMFGSTKLQRALGRTITNNFAKIVEDSGKSNEYFDTIFTGENAINIADLVSREDITTFLNIAQKALVIYDDYSANNDILDVIINSSKDVTDLTNEILKLTVFNSESSESLNPLISDLLETALANSSMFKGLKLEDIDWIKNGSADGEIETFVKCLNKFLETGFLTYDGEIKLAFNNFEKLFDSTTDTSVIDDVSTSKALRCVLTSVLKNTQVSGSDIYIPDTSLDTSGIIKAEEFKELFDSIGEIVEKTDFSMLEPLTVSEISDNVLPKVLESASEDKLLASAIVSSDILASIMSKIAYETLNEKYPGAIVDDLVLDDEHIVQNMPNWIGPDGELAIFLNIACDLYSEEVITYNGEIEFNLSNLSRVTTDTSYLITDAPRSLLLRGMLVELTNSLIGETISLIFPEESYTMAGSVKLLTEDELRSLLKSVAFIANSIDLEEGLDTSQMAEKFIDVIKTSDDIDRLSGSVIIEATVSKLLYDSLSETTYLQTIPDDLKLDSEHFDDNIKNWYGEGKEFSKAIKALREILKSGIVEVSLSPSVSVETNINNVSNLFDGQAVEPIDTILESQILLTMVSGVVEDLDIGYELYLPTEVYENNNISALEIKKLLKACNLLLSSNIDFNSPTISDDIKSALNDICSLDTNKDLIIDSTIMSGTLSLAIYKILVDMSSGTITFNIPDELVLDEANKEANISNWMGNDNELRKILDCLSVVDLTSVDNIDFVFKLSQEDVNVISNSKIVASTISNTVDSLDISGMEIIVVDEAYDENGNISSTELYNTINAIKAIVGYDDLNEEEKNNFSFDTISIEVGEILSNQAKVDAIFSSLIIQATVAYKAYSLTKDILSIPDELVLETPDSANMANWITINNVNKELYYIVDGLRVLEIADKISDENFEIDASNIISTLVTDKTDEEIEDNINTLLLSKIIYKTVSKTLIDMDADAGNKITVPSTVLDGDYVIKSELVNLFLGINAAGLTNLDNIDSVDFIFKMSQTDVDALCNSLIIATTITTTVNTLSMDEMQIVVVDEAYDENGNISSTELYNTINVIKVLVGYDDLNEEEKNTFSFDTISIEVGEILSNQAKVDAIFSSLIIQATVAYKAYSLTKDILEVPTELVLETPDSANMANWITINNVNKELYYIVDGLRVLGIADQISDPAFEIDASNIISTLVTDKTDIEIEDNINTLLLSKIIYKTVSKTLIDMDADAGNKITVPSAVLDGDYIIKSELVNLFLGINAAGLTNLDDIDSVDFIFKMSQADVDALCNSLIIATTITTTVNTLSMDEMQIVVVDEAYDTNGNISSTELYNTINAIKVFVGYDALTEEEKNTFSFDTISIEVGEILSNQAKVDAIFSSLIIQATVAYQAYSLTKDILSIPTELVLETPDSQNMANWITINNVNKELYYIVDGLRVLGIADQISDPAFEIDATDVISTLVTGKTDEEIESNINTLLLSTIIYRTMSKIIIDNGNSASMISVPSSVVDGDYITKEELVSLFVGINAAGLTNIDDVDANVIITNSIDTTKVLQSGILWYTFSTTILNTAAIIVPNIVKETNGTEIYITKEEITSLINTIKVMEISDFNNIDVNEILNLTDDNLNTVLNSVIVWYMISDNVFDVEVEGTIKIPSIAKGSDSFGDEYITKEEIIKLINAVEAFGVSDVNSIDPNILVTSSTVNINVICTSDIVRYTISDNMINCGISPSTYSYDDKNASELFIKTTEIKNTIEALKALGLTKIDEILIDNSQFLSLYSDGDKVDTLLASYIVYREVSNQICKTSGIDVPEDVIKNPGDLTLDEQEKYITKTEIKALLTALNKLGISDLASYEVSNKIFSLGSDLSTCLESHIIWYAFSKEIKASSELIVVSTAYDTTYPSYIRADQIIGLINVLSSLSASPSLSSVSLNPSSIVTNGLADDIAGNIILNATASNIILYENMVGTIYDIDAIETTTYNEDSSYVMFKSTELENIINGLAVLGISDVDGFSFSISQLQALSDEDLNTVLNSNTLWLYSSDLIKSYVALLPEAMRPTLETISEMVYKYDGTNFTKTANSIITKEQIISYV